MFIHSFLKKLSNLIQIRLNPNPKSVDYSILQDVSYNDSNKINLELISNKKLMVFEIFETLFRPIDFHSFFLFLFGVMDLLFILLFLFKIPFETCFKSEILLHEKNQQLEKFAIFFSLFGILINFNTKYLSKGKVESSHFKIITTYLRSSFFIDFIGFLGILLHFLIDINESSSFLCLIYFIKILSLEKLINNIEAHFSFCKKYSKIYSTTLWLLQFLSIIHFLCCVWYVIEISIYEDSDIFTRLSLDTDDINYKYLLSLYFINTNANLFGGTFFGVLPKHSFEVFGVLVVNLLSLSFIVYLYQTVFIKYYQKEMITIHKFMKKKEVSQNLRRKIDNYLQYFYEKEEKTVSPGIIVNKMGDTLKKQLFIESYLPILKTIPFFSRNFTVSTLKKLSTSIIERTFQPGEIILPESPNNKHFYYILKGEVDVCFSSFSSTSLEKSIKKLLKGDSFNESSFFSQNLENLGMKSVHNSSLLMINSDDFLSIIKENQRDYEVYCNLKDEVSLYGNCSNLHKNCLFCKNPAHLLTNCPLIHYYPSSNRVISTSYYKDKLSRNLFSRKKPKIKRFNALKCYKKIADTAFRYQSNFSMELNGTNTSRKKSISTSPPPIHRNRKLNLEEKKESIFNNNSNNEEVATINNTSTSSYTQKEFKKHPNDGNQGALLQNQPIGSSDTISISVRNPTESLSHKILNIINENRMIYHNILTDKSISSEFPHLDHSNERVSKSSDFKNIDFNRLTKKKNPFESSAAHFFDKQPVSSFSFEEVKIWPRYFPKNNVVNVIKKINNQAEKKSTIFLNLERKKEKEKEEIFNKSKNSSNSSKINRKKSSQESLLGKFMNKKKMLTKSKTESEGPNNCEKYERNKTVFEKIKTFFMAS